MPNSRRIIDHPMYAQLFSERTSSGIRLHMGLFERGDDQTGYGYVRSPTHLRACATIQDLFDDPTADFTSRRKVPVLVSGVISEATATFRGRLQTVKNLMCTSVRKDDGNDVPDFS